MAIFSATEERLQISTLSHLKLPTNTLEGQDVVSGLSQYPKSLPPKYFYDRHGSELFEKICDLPEYYPTTTEASILHQRADEIARIAGVCELVELGSGSSTKTRYLLDAYAKLSNQFNYIPIDVSGSILTQSSRQLLQDYPSLQIRGLVGTYEQALATLPPVVLPSRMLLFLGSSLGNMNPEECDRFFEQVVTALDGGEYFLLGVDLQKPKAILEAAYNDAQGVTAQFNLNILEHLNQRFAGNFNTENFEHWAFYNQQLNQIEMHLRCLKSHTVNLKSLNLTVKFEAGETINTEISRKFDIEEIQNSLSVKGLKPLQAWSDSQQWFGLILSQKL